MQDCLHEMLTHWLSHLDLKPSWKGVTIALRSQAVNYPELAENIERLVQSKSTAIEFAESHGQLCTPSNHVTEVSEMKNDSQPTTMPDPVDRVHKKSMMPATTFKPKSQSNYKNI